MIEIRLNIFEKMELLDSLECNKNYGSKEAIISSYLHRLMNWDKLKIIHVPCNYIMVISEDFLLIQIFRSEINVIYSRTNFLLK